MRMSFEVDQSSASATSFWVSCRASRASLISASTRRWLTTGECALVMIVSLPLLLWWHAVDVPHGRTIASVRACVTLWPDDVRGAGPEAGERLPAWWCPTNKTLVGPGGADQGH